MNKFRNVGIAGLGLIGGCLALEIKKRGIAHRVTGFSRKLSTLKKAKEQGIIDGYCRDFEKGMQDLDFLVIATPIRVMNDYFTKINKHNPCLFVIDVASVKESVVKNADEILGRRSNFVGCHPMAGSEKRGIGAVREGLFEDRFTIITPGANTSAGNVLKAKRFWKSLGSKPVILSPSDHDRLIALTSHMPHLAVYSLIALIEKSTERDTLLKCAGTGFLDTTRIGKSSPELWAEIFIANRKNMISCIAAFEKTLSEIKGMLESESYGRLTEKLDVLKKTREAFDGKRKNF